MAKIELDVLDVNWPRLTLVGKVTDANGIVTLVDERVNHDQAYSQFEVALHNHLRKAVETTIQRRKGR